MDTAIQQLPKTAIVVLWILWIELYWFSFTILLSILFWFLSSLDTILWYYMARRNDVVSSKMWQDWVVGKTTQFIILAIIILISWHLSYSSGNQYIDMACSFLSIVAALAFCTWQVISILENLAMITHWAEQWLIKFAIRVLLRVFWIWMDRVEQKLERYAINK